MYIVHKENLIENFFVYPKMAKKVEFCIVLKS